MLWNSINFSVANLLIGLLVGLTTGVITSHFGKYIKTKEEDRSLKGILILWNRSPWQTVMLIVLLAPVAEEILFRFLGISVLSHFMMGIWPLIITSALFGLAHNQYPINIISGTLGLILALVFQSYGLPAAIIAHGIHNGVSLTYLMVKVKKFLNMSLSKALKLMSINEIMQILNA